MAMILRWLTLCLLLAVPLSTALADPLPQPPPVGTWAAFPNSALRPAMLAAPGAPVTCCDAKYIFDYSGGWWDEDRQELGVWGGGHGDYPGNEVCTFPVSTGRWTCGPRSAYVIDPTTDALADGKPAARHTYASLARINAIAYDGFFVHGGSLWRLGYPVNGTWFYHRDTAIWERLPPRLESLGMEGPRHHLRRRRRRAGDRARPRAAHPRRPGRGPSRIATANLGRLDDALDAEAEPATARAPRRPRLGPGPRLGLAGQTLSDLLRRARGLRARPRHPGVDADCRDRRRSRTRLPGWHLRAVRVLPQPQRPDRDEQRGWRGLLLPTRRCPRCRPARTKERSPSRAPTPPARAPGASPGRSASRRASPRLTRRQGGRSNTPSAARRRSSSRRARTSGSEEGRV